MPSSVHRAASMRERDLGSSSSGYRLPERVPSEGTAPYAARMPKRPRRARPTTRTPPAPRRESRRVPARGDLFGAVRRVLKQRGLAYGDLARGLGMSESGVKKMFAHQDCSLSRLDQILALLDLELPELFDVAARPAFEEVALTDAQQRALLDDPTLLAVFWKLSVERWGEARIARELRIDATAMRRAIHRLDRLDLIVLEQPGDRVRLRHGDLVRWLPSGPLLDHLLSSWGRDVLDRAMRDAPDRALLRLHQVSLSAEGRRELETDLAALLDAHLRRGRREALVYGEAKAPPHGLLVALAEGSFVRAPAANPKQPKKNVSAINPAARSKAASSRSPRGTVGRLEDR